MATPEFKITILGDGLVGKTSLCNRFLGKAFPGDYIMTMGTDISLKEVKFNEKRVKLQIWDIAGQKFFKAVRKAYFSGAVGALFVFDITRSETLKNGVGWVQEFWAQNGKGKCPVVILGNKIDLRESTPEAVSPEEGQALAYELSDPTKQIGFEIPYLETSAKTGENVDRAFFLLTEGILAFIENRLSE
ncbi:MAG: Rab family GTPase [Candidatus Hodarchaeota archaeon]